MKNTAFPRLRAAACSSHPVTRFLRALALAFLFCAAAALPLQAATTVYFTNPTSGGGWATDVANWSTSSSGTSGSDWVNGNYAYFFSTGISPANPFSVTVGSAGVTTARITDVNSPGNLTFNSSTITLVGGANLTGYCLIRNETGNQMIFNSVIAGSSVGLYTGFSSGTIVLGGANTYSGGTIVGAGTLVIQNGTSATGTGNVTVEVDPNNSTLVGTLTWNTATAKIPGSVTVGGASGYTAILGPAGGVSALHIGGTLTFGNYSEPIFALSTTYNGANDQVAVTSTLTCGGVQVGISCGSTLDTSGNDYVLFTSGGVSGSFNSTPIWTATTPQYASQYTIITSGNQVHLHFTPIAIPVTAAANTKTYDGTTSAAATPTYTGTLAGGDSFSPTETYNSKDAGTSVTLTPSGTVSGGHGYYTYTYSTTTGTINKKALTVSGITAAATTYDGTTTAKLGGTAAFPGTEAAGAGSTSDGKPYSVDSVSAGGTAAGTLAAKDVGTQAVTITGVTVTGTGSGNYTVTQQTGLTQSITAKALTAQGTLSYSGKVYDGTTSATPSGAAGLLGTESLGSGTTSDGKPYSVDSVSLTGTAGYAYNSKDVATATIVTESGLSLTGTGNGNYTLTAPSLSAGITAKALTMSGLSVPASKVYDGTTAAAVSGSPGTLTGSESPGSGTSSDGLWYTGDTVSLSGTATGTYNSPDVASATTVTYSGLSLGGAQAGDYSLTIQSPASATITVATTAGAFTSSPNPSLPGSNVTFTATVTNAVPGGPAPAGNVQFKTNGVPLGDPVALDGSGMAAFITNSLPHGSNTLSAEYAGDGNFQGVTNRLVQIVNTPPVAAQTNAGITQNQTLVFSGAKLLSLCHDPDGDPLSITSAGPTSTNGGTVTLAGGNITYQPVTNFLGTDLFSFVVSDSCGGSATGTVLVAVTAANVPSPNIVIPPAYDSGSGTFSVTFAGIPGYAYTVQWAPAVTGAWSFLKTATSGPDGLFQVTDTELPPPPSRYYRTVYP